MRKDKRREKKSNVLNVIKVIIFLLLVISVFKLAPNYVKNSVGKEKINLIINNNNVTAKLKNDLWINEKNIIYMSKTDIKNYLDKYIYLDEANEQMITTYGEKMAVLPFDKNTITVNGTTLNLLSGVTLKNNEIYLPISQMANVYNMDITYVKEENTLILDSLEKGLVKADVSRKSKIRNKDTSFSGVEDTVQKGDKIIIVKEDKNWTKVRTSKGKIGYIQTARLQNKITVRENLKEQTYNEKINLVWDYYSEYATAPDRTNTTIEGINVVSPSFFSLVKKGKGTINENVGTKGIQYINWAKQNGYKVWAMFSNNSYKETTSEMLNSYKLRQNTINQIVTLANKYRLDGINIDFENMNESDRDMFSRFIIELKPRLQEAGVTLSVDVTAPDGGETWSMCYDRNVIGDVADYIVFMAYDQYGSSSPKEGTTAGYNWVETNLNKFIDREEINSNKIILGIPLYTRLWKEENGKITSKTVNMKNVDTVLLDGVNKTWDEELKQNYVEYTQDGATYKMWIEDEASIKEKVGLVKKYNLAGTAAWEKDRESEKIWTVINEILTK